MADPSSLVVALIAFAAGVLLRAAPSFPPGAAAALNAYVIWIALPALVLEHVPALRLESDLIALVVLPWVLLAASAALVLALSRARRWPREVEGALLLVVPLANTSFLGLPLVEAHLGPDAVAQAIVWDQLGSFLALSTYGAFVLAAYRAPSPAAPRQRPTLAAIARSVLVFPPFIALIVALVLAQTGTPALARSVFARFGDSLLPVVMLAVGLAWPRTLPRAALGPLATALTLRLVAAPALALALCLAFGVTGLTRGTAVLEAGMGPMITAGALALDARLAPDLTALILGWGTLLSFATTALWAALGL